MISRIAEEGTMGDAQMRRCRSRCKRRIAPQSTASILAFLSVFNTALVLASASGGLVGPGAMSTYSGGGGRRRPTSYVRVKEPAVGFFVAGSAEEGLNGLYGRTDKAPPGSDTAPGDVEISYRHLDTGWFMALRRGKGADDAEWVFVDPAGHERLVNAEYTLIPGSGQKWKHAPPKGKSSGWFSSFSRRGGGETNRGEETNEGDDTEKPTTDETRVEASKTQTKDTYHELPWQLIAIMGQDMLKQLAGHKRYHDGLVRAALNCQPPNPESGFRGSLDLVPPTESVEAASTPDADMAMEDGDVEEAAAKYAEALAQTPVDAEDENERDGWVRAVLGLRRARALRRLRSFGDAARQIEEVRASHPRYADLLFESALLWLDKGEPTAATEAFLDLACVDRSYSELQEWLVRTRTREKRASIWDDEKRKVAAEKAGERRRLNLISLGSTRHCVAWRQTGGCDPFNGVREPEKDLPCVEPVASGASGHCECSPPSTLLASVTSALNHGYALEHLAGEVAARVNATRASPLTCSHGGGITCAAECEKTWKESLRDVEEWTTRLEAEARRSDYAADGATEATAAMRTALDRMRMWERGEPLDDDSGAADAGARANVLQDFLNRARLGSDAILPKPSTQGDERDGWSDHYAVLSLPADFTDTELRAGYRRISLRFHPDKPGGSMADFQRVAEAYTVLSDETKRVSYDAGEDVPHKAVDGETTTVWDEVEEKHFPERYGFKPFGDPYERKREYEKRMGFSGDARFRGARDEF